MKNKEYYITKTIAYTGEIGGIAGIAWTESIGIFLCGATLYVSGRILNKHIDKKNPEDRRLENFLDKYFSKFLK